MHKDLARGGRSRDDFGRGRRYKNRLHRLPSGFFESFKFAEQTSGGSESVGVENSDESKLQGGQNRGSRQQRDVLLRRGVCKSPSRLLEHGAKNGVGGSGAEMAGAKEQVEKSS